jgi:pyruvate dehydrogenase E1 component alpha subunit
MAGGSMVKRAAGYGLPAQAVDGNDLEAVYFAAREAIQYVRSGKGPYVLECNTYRIEGHYYGDAMVYRSKEETDEWRKKDPILRVEQRLIERSLLTESDCRQIQASVQQEIDEAVQFAEASPEPDSAALFEDIYTGGA